MVVSLVVLLLVYSLAPHKSCMSWNQLKKWWVSMYKPIRRWLQSTNQKCLTTSLKRYLTQASPPYLYSTLSFFMVSQGSVDSHGTSGCNTVRGRVLVDGSLWWHTVRSHSRKMWHDLFVSLGWWVINNDSLPIIRIHNQKLYHLFRHLVAEMSAPVIWPITSRISLSRYILLITDVTEHISAT